MELGFGTGILYGIPLTDAAGNAISNGTPVQFGQLQDIAIDLSFDEKMLYGASQFPIAVGRGGRDEIDLAVVRASDLLRPYPRNGL